MPVTYLDKKMSSLDFAIAERSWRMINFLASILKTEIGWTIFYGMNKSKYFDLSFLLLYKVSQLQSSNSFISIVECIIKFIVVW